MIKSVIFRIALICIECFVSSYSQQAEYPTALRDVHGQKSFVFISDTQSPLWFEELFQKSDGNELATKILFNEIAKDSTVTAIFHLGDLTALGSIDDYWKTFDELTAATREAAIPIYPAFGNHEYTPTSSNGIANMIERFPFMKTPWYSKRIGNIGFIILNSNFSKLTDNQLKKQQSWYNSMLNEFDTDSTISLVIVGCHHPPYTNSKIVSPSTEVQNSFVPQYLQSRKAKIFISGHAHAFEHFHVSGKDFFVIGGGGGLLHTLFQGNEQKWKDYFPHESNRSFFHYIRFIQSYDTLYMQLMKLSPDRSRLDTINVFKIGVN